MPMYHGPPPPQMLYPPHLAPPGMMPYAPSNGYAQSTLIRPPPHPMHHHPSHYPVAASDLQYVSDQHRIHQHQKAVQEKRARRSRRKSESDKAAEKRAAATTAAFTYTGLDRTIADNFLEHQQAKQTSSSPEGSSLHAMGRGGDVAM